MTALDTNELRASGLAIGDVATRTVRNADFGAAREARAQLYGAADEIDRLTDHVAQLERALAAVPHEELCRLLMVRDDEPCSCAKSVLPEIAVTGVATTSYPDATRLTVAGPHGPVVGLPRVAGVHIDIDDHHLTVTYDNPGRTP